MMWFPKNPKVLVVDDHYNEVEPLLRLFSNNGISYVYFNGRDAPETPFTSIRLVILDINLDFKTHGLDDKSKASALATYLSQLIDTKNIPYAILFWTQHKEIIDSVINYLKVDDNNGAPVTWKDMEKPPIDELNIDYVKEKLFSDLNSKAFEFLIDWEESVSENATNFTNKLSKIVKQEGEEKEPKSSWDISMINILANFACAYTGTSKIDNSLKEDALIYATKILNQSFSEDLRLNLTEAIDLPEIPEISLKTIAKLNSILFIENVNDNSIEIGKVFFKEDESNFYNILKENFLTKKIRENNSTELIATILTPSCDLAHKKFLSCKNTNNPEYQYHRVLYGLKILIRDDSINNCFEYNASAESNKSRIDTIIDIDINITKEIDSCISAHQTENYKLEALKNKIKTLEDLKKRIKKCVRSNKPEYLYITQPFLDENQNIALFAFHFGTIQTIAIDPKTIKFSYLMKNSLISDLQTKLANHVNRLGNNMLEYKS